MAYSPKHLPVLFLVGLIIFIALINFCADYFHLYYHIWWLDIPMHLLGGFWIGFATLTIYYQSRRGAKDHSTVFVFCFAALAAVVTGLAWEIYEFVVDHVVSAFDISLGDTLKDLIDDLIGGLAAAAIFVRKRYNKRI